MRASTRSDSTAWTISVDELNTDFWISGSFLPTQSALSLSTRKSDAVPAETPTRLPQSGLSPVKVGCFSGDVEAAMPALTNITKSTWARRSGLAEKVSQAILKRPAASPGIIDGNG